MSSILNVDSSKLKAPEIGANKTPGLSGLSRAKSWRGFAVKVGASVAALGALSHVVYQGFYSPSRSSNDPAQSPFNSIYSKHVTSCNDTSFTALQTFFKVYETQGSLLNMLGFRTAVPFGDLQAFILNQNFDGLECAYSSYSKNQVNEQMKNRLLGLVMRQMANHKPGFEKYVKWLVDLGANPNLIDQGTTPLMLAYRMSNAELFEFLIRRGANPDNRLYSKSAGSSGQMQPILKIIADELGGFNNSSNEVGLSATRRRVNAEHCALYKRIVDSAIGAHTEQVHSFLGSKKDELQKEIYRTIAQSTCPEDFAVEEVYREEQEPQKGFFDWARDKLKSAAMHMEAWRRAQEEFLKDIPDKDRDNAYELLGLNEDELANMEPSEARKAVRSACKKMYLQVHPDKGGDEELFIRVREACAKLLEANKRDK